jgi:glycosyltransferase involved in cell wall biosynthesis
VTGKKLRVSVVVPAYNEEDAIGPCLDAILCQTVAADEIIVVDNDSIDGTAAVLRVYQDRIISIREPRLGVYYARNTGLDAATGDLIVRIDADTRLPAQWIEQVHELFLDPAVEAVTGPARYYDIQLPGLIARLDLLLRSAWARSTRQRLDWIYGANMAVRASAWHGVRGSLCEDRGIHEDVDLGIHLFHAGYRVIFVPALAAYTSSRRIRDSRRDFRAYLRMTETCYISHAALASSHAYRRAWLTNRLILLCYFPLRFLHRIHQPDWPGLSLHGLRAQALPTRKNPMSHS